MTIHFDQPPLANAWLASWFEQNLMPPESEPAQDLMRAMLSGRESECLPLYEAHKAQHQDDWAAATCIAAIVCIWEEGRAFERLGMWLDRASNLEAADHQLSHLARAALNVHGLIARLIWTADLPEAHRRLPAIWSAVEASESDSLRILLSAGEAHLLIMGGQLHAAEECLRDAAYFAPGPSQARVPKLHLACAAGLLDAVRGEAGRGLQALDNILTHEDAGLLPPTVKLLLHTHRLLCVAQTATFENVDQQAEATRAIVIPQNKAYHRSYLHFSLGVADLLQGQPAKALTHALLSGELGRLSNSMSAQLLPAFLQVQSLEDMGRDEEAQELIGVWLPRWQAHGFDLVTSAIQLESANLLMRRGQTQQAHQALLAAESALPLGEALPDYHRPRGFAAALRARLTSAPTDRPIITPSEVRQVHVTTLGGLHVRIGSRTLYDRDWRGKRTKALLKALVVLGGFKISTQRLCDLLWPDTEGDQALQNLKVALSRLRRLGIEAGEPAQPWLAVRHGQVSIVSGLCTVDALRFSCAVTSSDQLDAAQMLDALDLYTGDFLAGDDSETWIVEHRERLRRQYVSLAQHVADDHLPDHLLSRAERHLEAAIDVAPLDERSYELLMALHLKLDRPALALAVFERVEHTLRGKLDAPPGRPLQELLQQARCHQSLIKRN